MEYRQQNMFEKPTPAPLADRVRPHTLDDFVGQEHLLGPGRILRNMIDTDTVTSMIFWGPPGVGKTTLAMIIAAQTHAEFVNFSAVTSGIKEIKEVMTQAEASRRMGVRTIVFVDEIHRFNKAQQDAFLPHVERGSIILIGATTENPSFEINSALLSRCRVFVLHTLGTEDIVRLLRRTVENGRGFEPLKVHVEDDLLHRIAVYANGDARMALNTLDIAVTACDTGGGEVTVTPDAVAQCIDKRSLLYDKNGEEHYNLISALHKSMRNSDCDASVYWLARMLESGEDPMYIARRVVRFASEDIGMADPRALGVAVAASQAAHLLGMPECSVNLAQAVVYMACAPKSNALYRAYSEAQGDAQKTVAEGVPLHLRNAPTRLMKEVGYGEGYRYAHDYAEKTTDMQCLPDNLKDRVYYTPTDQGAEKRVAERLEYLKKLKRRQKGES